MVPYEEGNPDFKGYPGEELTDAADEDWFSLAHEEQFNEIGDIIDAICALDNLENMFEYYEEEQ